MDSQSRRFPAGIDEQNVIHPVRSFQNEAGLVRDSWVVVAHLLDRMFASGFAYRDNGKLLPEGLLKGKSVVCVSTMKGPAKYPLLWLHDAHKVLMKKALFNFVGIRRVRFFEFGSMESPKGRQEAKLKKVYRYFRKSGARTV